MLVMLFSAADESTTRIFHLPSPDSLSHLSCLSCLSCPVPQICVGNRELDCMDVEFKADRPKSARLDPALPNDTSRRDLCLENDVLRAYRVKLAPGESIDGALAVEGGAGSESKGLGVGFAYLAVALKCARLSRGEVQAGDNWWGGGGVERTWSNVGGEEAEVMILQPK